MYNKIIELGRVVERYDKSFTIWGVLLKDSHPTLDNVKLVNRSGESLIHFILNWNDCTNTLFNKNGFDKYGFNKDGFDKDGFDKYGFDKDGFNKKGFDKYGFDKEGFDKSRFDKDGFNKKGFNKDGIHKAEEKAKTIIQEAQEQAKGLGSKIGGWLAGLAGAWHKPTAEVLAEVEKAKKESDKEKKKAAIIVEIFFDFDSSKE